MTTRGTYILFIIFLILIGVLVFPNGLHAQEPPILERIADRFTGPLHLRVILQPLVAIILGIKYGRSDFKKDHPPFFLDIISDKLNRNQKLKMAYRSILTPFLIGVVVDAIFQYIVFHKIHLYGTLLAGIVLIAIPYTLSRGFTNRILKRQNK
jgi:hypothetical protein